MSDKQSDHEQAYGEGRADVEAGKEDPTHAGHGVFESLVDAASGGIIGLVERALPSYESSTEDQSYQTGHRDSKGD
jgi:hypothetical protein